MSAPTCWRAVRDPEPRLARGAAAPSQWLETGPLVVLEAFAAGTAVIGSHLGGIAELVRNGFDGILVDAANIREWANALHRLSEDRDVVNRLRRNIGPPRKTSTVAKEMIMLYRKTLANHAARAKRFSNVNV